MKQALSWSPGHSPVLPSTLPRPSRTGVLTGQGRGAELGADSTHARRSGHGPPRRALCPGPRPTDLLDRGLAPAGGEAAQDAALRHLQPRGHGRDAGQHGGQARHVGLHVAQQLLELVQHCKAHPEALSRGTPAPAPGAAGSRQLQPWSCSRGALRAAGSLPIALRTLVQDGICRLVPSKGLFGEMLVALSKALHFSQTGVQCHGRVIGVLSHVEVRSPSKLLLYHQGLLQQLGGTGEQGLGTDSGLHQCKPVSLRKLQLPTCLPSSPAA